MKKIRTNIYLLARQLKRLEAESKRSGSSVAELVRKAIDAVYPEGKQS
jgi:Ribbon-helix-helix protein, copG family